MALLSFQRPDKITLQKATDFEGKLSSLNLWSQALVLQSETRYAEYY